MANSPQAKKRARQQAKTRLHKSSQRSMVRTYIKRIYAALESGSHEDSLKAYQTASPLIDRMVNKGIIHKNKAARLKARLNAKVKALAA